IGSAMAVAVPPSSRPQYGQPSEPEPERQRGGQGRGTGRSGGGRSMLRSLVTIMVALIGAAGVIIAAYVTVTKGVEAKVSKVTKSVEEKTAATETRLNATVGALAANTPGSLEKGQ